MNKQEFIDIISNPQQLDAEALKKLEELATSFPYCQAAHVLIAKSTNDHGSMTAGLKVKKASAYTSDRKNLRHLLLRKPVSGDDQEILSQEDTPKQNSEITNIIHEIAVSKQDESSAPIAENQTSTDAAEPNPSESAAAKVTEDNSFGDTGAETNQKALHSELHENLNRLRSLRPQIIEDQGWHTPEEPEKRQDEVSLPNRDSENQEEIIDDPDNKKNQENQAFQERMPFNSESEGESFPEIKDENQELITGYLDYLNNRKKARRDPKKINMLIEKFIKEEPAISPLTPEKVNQPKDLAARSVKSGGPVSETFAKILEKQGKFEKAISVYEQLILKYPEKTAYFASLIEDLKNKIKE